ncbi:hypothetical protein [Nocardioides sp. B-3]|uniref:hypothetical protein n=1 Tax=Nocardioides sp. B-3 TaxID=2895565 RepID=UPI00215265D7|nr:hypothetical protein [Nocardioides sp. B-3]UUZ57628.1 hypothetical protein LP418_14290 [Nocardioides sp. B-3]
MLTDPALLLIGCALGVAVVAAGVGFQRYGGPSASRLLGIVAFLQPLNGVRPFGPGASLGDPALVLLVLGCLPFLGRLRMPPRVLVPFTGALVMCAGGLLGMVATDGWWQVQWLLRFLLGIPLVMGTLAIVRPSPRLAGWLAGCYAAGATVSAVAAITGPVIPGFARVGARRAPHAPGGVDDVRRGPGHRLVRLHLVDPAARRGVGSPGAVPLGPAPHRGPLGPARHPAGDRLPRRPRTCPGATDRRRRHDRRRDRDGRRHALPSSRQHPAPDLRRRPVRSRDPEQRRASPKCPGRAGRDRRPPIDRARLRAGAGRPQPVPRVRQHGRRPRPRRLLP